MNDVFTPYFMAQFHQTFRFSSFKLSFNQDVCSNTKSFERFRQPINVEEKKSIDNAVMKSTAYKTKWSCKLFEHWKQVDWWSTVLGTRGSSWNGGHNSHNRYVCICSHNYWLLKFVQKVNNSSGERYLPVCCTHNFFMRTEVPLVAG